jgi:Zn-finger nucleic acid-binding protein
MNCRNCGAAMVLSATKGHSHCEHCGSFYFPQAEDDGVKTLGEPSRVHRCPGCEKPLSPASLDNHGGVLYCTNCRGLLLPRAVFATVVQMRRAWAGTPPTIPPPLDRAALDLDAACPSCSTRMTTHAYQGPGSIVIDTCDRCDVIWLGTGELTSAVNAPGRDRGSALRAGEGAAEFGVRRGTTSDDDDEDEDDGDHMRRGDVFPFLKDLM